MPIKPPSPAIAYRSATRPPQRGAQYVAPDRPPHGDPLLTHDGRRLRVRAIHPADAEALQRAFARLTPDQVRSRFFYRMNGIDEALARRLTHPDPETTAAFVVLDEDGSEIRGEARIHVDAATASAEFALAVDPAFTGQGVGLTLMRTLIAEARRRGLAELWGEVLTENVLMLDLAGRLGAQREPMPGEHGVLRVRFDLARLPDGTTGSAA